MFWHLPFVLYTVTAFEIAAFCDYRGFAAHNTPAVDNTKPIPEPKSSEQPGWFSRFIVDRDRDIDTGHEQHSSRLSDKDTVYELQCNYCSLF